MRRLTVIEKMTKKPKLLFRFFDSRNLQNLTVQILWYTNAHHATNGFIYLSVRICIYDYLSIVQLIAPGTGSEHPRNDLNDLQGFKLDLWIEIRFWYMMEKCADSVKCPIYNLYSQTSSSMDNMQKWNNSGRLFLPIRSQARALGLIGNSKEYGIHLTFYSNLKQLFQEMFVFK